MRESTSSRHWSNANNRDDVEHCKESRPLRKHLDDNTQLTQDMDISPGDSTPTSEVNYNHSITGVGGSGGGTTQNLTMDPNAIGPVLLATALPRLISHPLHLPSTPNSNQPETSPANNPQSTPSMVPPPASVTTSNAPGPPITPLNAHLSTISTSSPIDNSNNLQLTRQGSHTEVPVPLSVDTNNMGPVTEGPPTPTHSETPDCAKGNLFHTRIASIVIILISVAVVVPNESPQSGGSNSLSTLQGVASSLQALRPQGPTITPSLANHVRDDLTNHIKGWPADILEKQVSLINFLNCSYFKLNFVRNSFIRRRNCLKRLILWAVFNVLKCRPN